MGKKSSIDADQSAFKRLDISNLKPMLFWGPILVFHEHKALASFF